MKWWLIGGLMFLAGAAAAAAQSTGDLYRLAVDAGTQYRSAYSAYIQAKNQHLQYHTGATRVEVNGKTNSVLVKRNVWMIGYLKYLRQSLTPETVTYSDLENEINFLSGLTSLGSGDSFSKINANSIDWEKRLEQTDKLIGASQLQVSSTKLANFQNQLGEYVDGYKQNHASPSASQATTLNLIMDKLTASIADRTQIDQRLSQYHNGYWSSSNYVQQLVGSHQQLLEAAKLLEELSRKL